MDKNSYRLRFCISFQPHHSHCTWTFCAWILLQYIGKSSYYNLSIIFFISATSYRVAFLPNIVEIFLYLHLVFQHLVHALWWRNTFNMLFNILSNDCWSWNAVEQNWRSQQIFLLLLLRFICIVIGLWLLSDHSFIIAFSKSFWQQEEIRIKWVFEYLSYAIWALSLVLNRCGIMFSAVGHSLPWGNTAECCSLCNQEWSVYTADCCAGCYTYLPVLNCWFHILPGRFPDWSQSAEW